MEEQKKNDKIEKDFKKEYELLRAKHSLPALADLDREFVIGSLEPTDFLLRTILGKIDERCEFMIKTLSDFIQPENSLVDMHEAEGLTDEDKKNAFELLKKTSYYQNQFLIADFDYSDEAAAALINRFYLDWKGIKSEFLKMLCKIRDAWGAELKKDQEYGYFG